MKNDASKHEYDKIGGYNRADGYFLEAQMYGTKLIWENKEKKKIEEKKEKTQIIKFQNIEVKSMTKSDFPSLLNIERKVYTREDPDLIQG